MYSSSVERKQAGHVSFREKYQRYKENYVKNMQFDSENGIYFNPPTPLEEVYIFFDTATYDEIERDVR